MVFLTTAARPRRRERIRTSPGPVAARPAACSASVRSKGCPIDRPSAAGPAWVRRSRRLPSGMSKDPLFLISDISSIHGLFVENRPTGPPACASGRTCNLSEVTARLVVLISGTGTNLAGPPRRDCRSGLRRAVVAVGADRDGIEGLARAEKAEIPTFVRSVKAFADPRGVGPLADRGDRAVRT